MLDCTLLIPCYNAARFLPRLMEGVAWQRDSFGSILCYDDGSTDDTVAVAKELGMRVVTGTARSGVAAARNRLVENATTEWVHFHDADDLISPDYFPRLAPFCRNGIDVVSCDADWVEDESRAPVIQWRYDPGAMKRTAFPYLLAHPLGLNNSIIRRSAWQAVQGCDESLAIWEDADLHIRLARNGARFHHLPEVLTYSLRRAESLSTDYRLNWQCRLATLQKYADHPTASEVAGILAEEAEKAAGALLSLNDTASAREAIALCRRFGVHPPSTAHPLFRALKPFVPAITLLRWQQSHRAAAHR